MRVISGHLFSPSKNYNARAEVERIPGAPTSEIENGDKSVEVVIHRIIYYRR